MIMAVTKMNEESGMLSNYSDRLLEILSQVGVEILHLNIDIRI